MSTWSLPSPLLGAQTSSQIAKISSAEKSAHVSHVVLPLRCGCDTSESSVSSRFHSRVLIQTINTSPVSIYFLNWFPVLLDEFWLITTTITRYGERCNLGKLIRIKFLSSTHNHQINICCCILARVERRKLFAVPTSAEDGITRSNLPSISCHS